MTKLVILKDHFNISNGKGMQFTVNGEYAIRAMLDICAQNGKLVHIQDISKRWEIPENMLRKLVPLLTQAGLIYSRRGKGGGLELARAADQITPLQVLEAIDGKVHLHRCLLSDVSCTRSSWCAMHGLWLEAQAKLRDVLASKNLAQLVNESGGIGSIIANDKISA